jgi:hypothetical protein
MLVSERTRQTPHTSLFRRRLERLAGSRPLNDWLVDELNRRGHLGAFAADQVGGEPTAGVSLEELIVALAMPQAEADGRHWKLIVRALQRGPVDARKLARLARLERAEVLLAWLLSGVPSSELTTELAGMAELIHPRERRPPDIRYDFDRLIRRPATRENAWRRPHD